MKSEPSKWLPIILSCLALTISGIGLRDNYRGRTLNEAVNRPVVMVDLDARLIPTKKGGASGQVVADVKNVGKTAAIINKVDSSVLLLTKCDTDQNPVPALQDNEILPGLTENSVIHQFRIKPPLH